MYFRCFSTFNMEKLHGSLLAKLLDWATASDTVDHEYLSKKLVLISTDVVKN